MNWTNKLVLYKKILLFQNNNIKFMPWDIKKICKKYKWSIIPYDANQETVTEISEDGFCFHDKGNFHIFYNKGKPIPRQKFTIAHEVGHIILNHHKYISPKILQCGGTGLWEEQANIFAQNILFPIKYAQILKGYPTTEVARQLGLSKQMVEVRYNKLQEDLFWIKKIKNR